jgi:hypothetical protein
MADENEQMRILDMIDSGQITAEEGLRLLEALAAGEEPALEAPTASVEAPGVVKLPLVENEAPGPASIETPLKAASLEAPVETGNAAMPAEPASAKASSEAEQATQSAGRASAGEGANALPPNAARWRHFWRIPLWIGVGITVLGAALMYQAMQASGLGFWFVCALAPFVLGLLVIIFAWQARTAPWIHLRVEQKPGERPQRIAISFPIPVRPAVWFLRRYGHKIPDLKGTSLDEIILAIGETTSPENPIYIQADEGEDGERVEIYIG